MFSTRIPDNSTTEDLTEQRLSLFEDRNATYDASESPYTLAGALMLSGKLMTDWWEISLSIFLWMSLSFTVIYLGATFLSLFTMRKHPYVCFFVLPLLGMIIVGPMLLGAPTSMVMAFAMSASKNAVSTWFCMFAGVLQTLLIFLVSITRLLATL
ncbi:unnamed protein product [Caenorhabditis auriculariae]|uniref:Transmembrane protein n=1 Tax=Caenorhabditis auriculariae TaxID=2777116 RepID=A0A8S1HVA1_9PELO|nr:unnamed protein product [Caenorhabditis auriculariae]